MKKILNLLFAAIIGLLSILSCTNQESEKALIYTFAGEGYVHKNIESSARALEGICREQGLEPLVSDDPAVFTTTDLGSFALIIFANTNRQAFLNDQQRAAFRSYVENGGGFMGVHSANTSEPEWDWFVSMIGGTFRWHPPYQEFEVLKLVSDHPSTAALPERWKVSDECYYSERLNPAIEVLIAVDMTTVEDSTKGDYPGPVFGDLFPLCWSLQNYGGRQWFTALGHDPEVYSDPLFREHLSGGLSWVLGAGK